MIVSPHRLNIAEHTCTKCGETKIVSDMQKRTYGDGWYVYPTCLKCKQAAIRVKRLKIFVPDEPAKMSELSYYKGAQGIDRFRRHQRYKRYCKAHAAIQKRLCAITSAGININQNCEKVDRQIKEKGVL